VNRTQRQLVLHKGPERFVFRYEEGREDQLLDALIEMAESRRTSFDWFDAAVLSFKLTQSLLGQAQRLIGQDGKVHVGP